MLHKQRLLRGDEFLIRQVGKMQICCDCTACCVAHFFHAIASRTEMGEGLAGGCRCPGAARKPEKMGETEVPPIGFRFLVRLFARSG